MSKEAQKRYKKKVESWRVELYPTDEDIKRQLKARVEAGEPRTTYVKRLIREDIARQEFVAFVTVFAGGDNENALTTFAVVDSRHEVAKQEAYEQIPFICKSNGVPAGNLYIELQVTQGGEYIDGDEFSAVWNGETISAE